MRLKVLFFCGLVSCLFSSAPLFAVRVPQTAPKALKETQDPEAANAHETALHSADAKPAAAPVVPPAWIEQIRQMATENSKRDGQPIENLEVTFKKDGSLARLQLMVARNAKRTPNDSRQNHAVCRATVEGKEHQMKLHPEETVEGPDLYEIFGIDQLATACQELSAAQRLQKAFTANGLNYTLQANAIVAPDGKSWAWEIAPSEEQMPNVIYALYYYPITQEIHSIRLDNKKAAARLEKAAADAGMKLKWVKDMNDR